MYMTLGGQVIDLIRLYLLYDPEQVGCIGKITIMQDEFLVFNMRILIEMIYPTSVEGR